MFDLKLDDLKGAFEVTIKIAEGVWKAIKWICITLAYCVTCIAIAIGIKKRRKE